MSTMTTMTRSTGPMTRAELDALPDDGRRHELIDGVLIVSPSPRPRHQVVLARLSDVMRAARPSGVEVLFAPLDVVLAVDTIVEPDLLVARVDDFGERDLPVPPLLAVEVLSSSTRRTDLTLKKARYEAAGTPSYWVVDPDEETFTAWELRNGEYVRTIVAGVGESVRLERPYPVEISVSDLFRR